MLNQIVNFLTNYLDSKPLKNNIFVLQFFNNDMGREMKCKPTNKIYLNIQHKKTPKTEGKIKSDNVTKLTSKSARNASKQPGEIRTLINSI